MAEPAFGKSRRYNIKTATLLCRCCPPARPSCKLSIFLPRGVFKCLKHILAGPSVHVIDLTHCPNWNNGFSCELGALVFAQCWRDTSDEWQSLAFGSSIIALASSRINFCTRFCEAERRHRHITVLTWDIYSSFKTINLLNERAFVWLKVLLPRLMGWN